MIVLLILAASAAILHRLQAQKAATLRLPLEEFPVTFGPWRGEDRPFDAHVVQKLAADAYLNRLYSGDAQPLELYVGFYGHERPGDTIHSPRNCLPGAGWVPVHSADVPIGWENGRPLLVNEYLVEKGSSRDLVLYWYEAHGRVVASDYRAKFWLVADSLRRKGSDCALIRIWTTAVDGNAVAERRAVPFAQSVHRQLGGFLPD